MNISHETLRLLVAERREGLKEAGIVLAGIALTGAFIAAIPVPPHTDAQPVEIIRYVNEPRVLTLSPNGWAWPIEDRAERISADEAPEPTVATDEPEPQHERAPRHHRRHWRRG